MKDRLELVNQYNAVESKLGFNPLKIQQGDDNWLRMKLGVISVSNFSKILKPKTQGYKTYLLELVSQVCTGHIDEQIISKPLQWGHAQEPIARDKYSFMNDKDVSEFPFIYRNERMRAGCSPDGIIMSGDDFIHGLEIKAPYTTKYHVEFITDSKIKSEYIHQCQGSMFITGLETWDFCSFDPRMPSDSQVVMKTMERDDSMMAIYLEAIDETIYNMDKMLKQLEIEFGHQWNVPRDKGE